MENVQYRPAAIRLLVVLGALCLWPALSLVGLLPRHVETFENRALAPFPGGIGSRAELEKWPRAFDAFLDDHLPGRGALLRLNAWLKYYLFQTTSEESVLVGRDGWLFHRTAADVLEAQGRLRIRKNEMRRMRVILEERRDWLRERGIDYVVAVVPTKQTVYPEKLPAWLENSGPHATRRGLLAEELERAGSTLAFVDLTPALQRAKARWGDDLYYPHDSHWNPLGATQGYAELSARYPNWFPDLKLSGKPEVVEKESNLMNMMGLPGSEKTAAARPVGGMRGTMIDPDTPSLQAAKQRGVVEVRSVAGRSAPRLYLMGDSFSYALAPYVAENFSRTVLTNTWGDQWAREEQFPVAIIEEEKPGVLLHVMLENRLSLGITRSFLGDVTGETNPPEVRMARLRRLSSPAAAADFRLNGETLEIALPGKMARAYVVKISFEAPVPVEVESRDGEGKPLWRRGDELTRANVGTGRHTVWLCAVADRAARSLRVDFRGKSAPRILEVSVSPFSDWK